MQNTSVGRAQFMSKDELPSAGQRDYTWMF